MSFSRARSIANVITNNNELDGFQELNDHEQTMISEIIYNENTTRVIKEPSQTCKSKDYVM